MSAPEKRSRGLLVVLLVVLGALALAAIGLAIFLARLPGAEPRLGQSTLLELDLSAPVPEHLPDEAFALAFLGRPATVREVVETLDRARRDDRVVGLVARVGSAGMGLARTQELRRAIAAFGEDKPTVAWAETFGEFSAANGAYYLATGFQEIHLQPSGDVGLTGIGYETPFYRGALDKLGMVPRIDSRREYKTGANTYTQTELTPEHEEMLQALADAQLAQLVEGIAAGRGLSPEEVRDLVDRGPFFGAEALAAGLVDSLAYGDEVDAELSRRFGEDVERVELDRYRRTGRTGRSRLAERGGTPVALIYGVGTVMRGESGFDPFTSSLTMGADTVRKAFREAIDDEVEAVLFRVDSPGGSYVASDTIWREVARAREAGVPVVVSMGDLAGSGGYFVAMGADRIVAQPGTLTGSIGVYGGKLVTEATWDKIGIGWGAVSAGERARMWSSLSDFSPEEWQRMGDLLDRIYDDFTAKVAAGRDLEPERVEELARGRVWTGAEAHELGLVDRLGGFPEAQAAVRELLGLAPDARLRLKPFPRPRSPFEVLVERRGWVAAGAEALAPLVELARRLGLAGPAAGPLDMPAVRSSP